MKGKNYRFSSNLSYKLTESLSERNLSSNCEIGTFVIYMMISRDIRDALRKPISYYLQEMQPLFDAITFHDLEYLLIIYFIR